MSSQSVLLVCHASKSMGIGHLSRIMVLARALRRQEIVDISILIFGEVVGFDGLNEFDASFLTPEAALSQVIRERTDSCPLSAIVLDLHPGSIPPDLYELLQSLKLRGISLIGLDGFLDIPDVFDLIWVPSFHVDLDKVKLCGDKLVFGWDAYLLRKSLPNPLWQPGNEVLVLTGGSDPTGLGEFLPRNLDAVLPANMEMNWVIGPFARPPLLPDKRRLKWNLHESPAELDHLIVGSNYALTVFGISFFEVMQYGIPTVVFSPYGDKDKDILNILNSYNVAEIASDSGNALVKLSALIEDSSRAIKISNNASSRLKVSGIDNLVDRIIAMAES